jgi:hypothetical protein
MIFLSILFILLGLAMIFARDFMWGLTEFSNQMAGRTSERTELWDTRQMISGAIIILVGAGVICWQISESSAEAAEESDATATAATRLAQLQDAFAPYIDQWEQNERQNAYRVSPRDLHVLARSIFYGRCSSNDFYIYVLGFNGQYNHYAYVPESDPRYCEPGGMSVGSPVRIGNGWYSISVFGTPEATNAPRPTTPTPEATAE